MKLVLFLQKFIFGILVIEYLNKMQKQEIKAIKQGVILHLPQDTTYKKFSAGYIFGHLVLNGLIMMLYHNKNSLSDLKTEMYTGFFDDSGFNIQVDGKIMEISDQMVLANYTGIAENVPSSGFGIGLLSPFQGGVVIVAIAAKESFSEEHKDFVEDLIRGVEFIEPQLTDLAQDWLEFLFLKRLIKQSIKNTKGEIIEISFIGEDTFKCVYAKPDHIESLFEEFESGGAKTTGQWEVQAVNNDMVLFLTLFDGSTLQFILEYQNEVLLLNNELWDMVEII
jgi:hypothetical protein